MCRLMPGSFTNATRRHETVVEQVKRMRPEAELVPIRLRLVEGEYLDEERYGVGNVAPIDAFPSNAEGP